MASISIMSLLRTRFSAVTAAGSVAVAALAAPVGTDIDLSSSALAPVGAPSAPATILAPGSLPDAGTSKTVDLLVELQSQQKGLPSEDSQKKSASAGRRLDPQSAANRGAMTPQAPHFGGLFSGSGPSGPSSRTAALEYSGGGNGSTDGYGGVPNPTLTGWLAWSREFIAFLRDHRGAVLAAAAIVLGLLWLRPGMGGRKSR